MSSEAKEAFHIGILIGVASGPYLKEHRPNLSLAFPFNYGRRLEAMKCVSSIGRVPEIEGELFEVSLAVHVLQEAEETIRRKACKQALDAAVLALEAGESPEEIVNRLRAAKDAING